MENKVIYSDISRSGDDWRVIDFMGLCYLVERNQGEHDQRFFQVGHPYKNQYEAIAKVKSFCFK